MVLVESLLFLIRYISDDITWVFINKNTNLCANTLECFFMLCELMCEKFFFTWHHWHLTTFWTLCLSKASARRVLDSLSEQSDSAPRSRLCVWAERQRTTFSTLCLSRTSAHHVLDSVSEQSVSAPRSRLCVWAGRQRTTLVYICFNCATFYVCIWWHIGVRI